MPIHEYLCPQHHRAEVIDVSNKARLPSIPCPECGERAVRIISATNWNINRAGPKQSGISRAIERVKKAEREGRLD